MLKQLNISMSGRDETMRNISGQMVRGVLRIGGLCCNFKIEE